MASGVAHVGDTASTYDREASRLARRPRGLAQGQALSEIESTGGRLTGTIYNELKEEQERQMKKTQIIGVCVAVAAALGLVTVASASASLPALYECHKEAKGHGKYQKGCKVAKEGGGFEIEEGIGKGKPFKGKGKGSDLEVEGNGGITCTSSSDTGKFTSPKTAADVVVTFKGCEFVGKKCESGSTLGEIITNHLKGEVGYLAGKGTGSPKVGADVKAETGEALSAFKCEKDSFTVRGSVIGEVGPINVFTKEATFTFKQSSKIGEQEWKKFEEGPEDILRTGVCDEEGCIPEPGVLPSAFETTVVNKGEDLMLKA
jgi:hypothetical protein